MLQYQVGGNQTMFQNRNLKLDNIKALLIFLTVLAHCLYSYTCYNQPYLANFVYLIYVFHMPLFCFISGYCSHKNYSREDFIKLLGLFLLTDASFYIYEYLMTGSIDLPLIKYSSWYILDLAIWRLCYSKIKNPRKVFFITFTISLLLSCLPNCFNVMGVYRLTYFFSFFLLGKMISLNKFNYSKTQSFINIALIITMVSIIINLYPFDLSFFTVASFNNSFELLFRVIFFISVYLVIIPLYNLIPNKEIKFITNWGRYSLSIYCFHRILAILFNQFFHEHYLFLPLSFVVSVVICLIFGNKYFKCFLEFISNLFTKVITWMVILITVIVIMVFRSSPVAYSNRYPIYDTITSSQINDLKDSSVTIGFVGDLILLEDQIKNSYQNNTYNFDDMFRYTKGYFQSVDYMIGVLEGPSNDNMPYSMGNFDDQSILQLNYPSSFLTSLKNNYFDLVTTSNNHLLDSGLASAYQTIDTLDQIGLDYIGTYKQDTYKRPKIVTIQNLQVGVLSYTYGINNYSEDELFQNYNYLTNYLCPQNSKYFRQVKGKVKDDFRYLKEKGVDLIVVLPHMGTQFSHDVSEYQQLWNNIFVDNDADVILGDRAHATEPIQYQNDTLIINSPGNYLNSYTKYDGDLSIMAKIYIDKETKKINATSIIPLYAYKQGNNAYTSLPIYDALSNENIYNSLSYLDIKRMQEGIKIVTKSTIGVELESSQLQNEYYYFEEGYKRQVVPPLQLEEDEQGNPLYEKMQQAKKICYIGDSITKGSNNGGYGWFEPIQNTLKNDYQIIAEGGLTSTDIVNKFSKIIKDSNCDLSVIAIGTNDIRYNSTSADIFLDNLNEIISDTNRNIIIISPWQPLVKDYLSIDEYYQDLKLYDQYEQELRKFSINNHYLYTNPNFFIQKSLIDKPSNYYYLDGIHPNGGVGIQLYSRSILHDWKP